MIEKQVEIKDKVTLTVKEAAAYSNIGENRIRDMLGEPTCDFVLYVGRNVLVKRKPFEEYLLKMTVL